MGILDNTLILYNTVLDNPRRDAVIFQDPVGMIFCDRADKINGCFYRLEKALSEGYFVAGFLSYELGNHFLEIPFSGKRQFPLFCFGIFDSLRVVPVDKMIDLLEKKTEREKYRIINGHYSVGRGEYKKDIEWIKDHLENGNTYQVNYTFKYKFDLKGSKEKLFIDLIKKQDVPYAGFFNIGRWTILSLSPELFFQRNKEELYVRPMKGTIGRGATLEEDEAKSRALAESPKDRAENVMIVDLLRNDLGKVSDTGSVQLEKLFSVEKYDTLFQMTSTIRSSIKNDVSWHQFFREVFPSGSVTGAPKKKTMEIINEFEREERNIYTGCLGYITPAKQAVFNVAIRTALIDNKTGAAEMGIGSGITYDSDADKEYDECLLKGSFLTSLEDIKGIQLIETILWERGVYFLLELHLERLEKSAEYFSYKFDKKKVLSLLRKLSLSFDNSMKYRVRLRMDELGGVTAFPDAIKDEPALPVKVGISKERTSSSNVFFQHKTTNRIFYDAELVEFRKKGFFDCLFFNEYGELTEGAISNVIIKKGDEYLTPPSSCGALAGVYREYIKRAGLLPLKEKVLYLDDLRKADEIFLANSVRKMIPAILSE